VLVLAGATLRLPLVGSLPLHAPPAVHDVMFAEDQLKSALLPGVIVDGLAERVAVGAELEVMVNAAVLVTEPPLPVQVSVKL
jgi:hypothetical protein